MNSASLIIFFNVASALQAMGDAQGVDAGAPPMPIVMPPAQGGPPPYPDNVDYQRWQPPPVYEPPRTGILHKLFETVGTLFMNLLETGGAVFEQLPIVRNLGKAVFNLVDTI